MRVIELSSNLFRLHALRLDDDEVQEDDLKAEPADINDITPPSPAVESDRIKIFIEDEANVDSQVEDVEILSARMFGQDFDGVGHYEGCKRDVVKSRE